MTHENLVPIRDVLQARAPASLVSAIRTVAARDMLSVSDFVRMALLEKLRSLGIDPVIEQSKGGRSRRKC